MVQRFPDPAKGSRVSGQESIKVKSDMNPPGPPEQEDLKVGSLRSLAGPGKEEGKIRNAIQLYQHRFFSPCLYDALMPLILQTPFTAAFAATPFTPFVVFFVVAVAAAAK